MTIEYNVTMTCLFKKKWDRAYVTLSSILHVPSGTTDADLLDQMYARIRAEEGAEKDEPMVIVFYRAVPNQLPVPTGTELC